ncbi:MULTISPECIES: tetratricopeptide repeat-containing sensor histidine kinase [unclassified Flavobacterium]|uniref:ATP-binding protein n=1 Tax=unclassified Flavobacterium TaxID=196869 RepID=UPI001E4A1C5F|nr:MULTISPECIES: tetratricopeptide repeat-containing sensor histidine kinase [unclassified Flavobacterium]
MLNKQITILFFFILSILPTSLLADDKPLTIKDVTMLANKALFLMREGNYEKSLIQSRFALSKAIQLKNDFLIAFCYNTIAANFDEFSETDKAFYYYNKGLTYANRTNNDVLKNNLHNNLGNIYCFDKKQYKKGVYYYKKSLEYSTKINDVYQILFTKLNITWAYFDIGDFKNGYPYLDYINKNHKKDGDASTIVAINMLNGMYYSSINDTKKATYYFENAIRLGNQGNEKSDLSFSYHEYSKFLIKTGNYKKAYSHLDSYIKLTEELKDEEKLKKANVAGINLEIDEYKREIDKIENEFKTKQIELLEEQYRNKKIVIVVAIILLLLSVVFYILTLNAKLQHKSKITDLQSKVQENILNASINGQELERKKIASFLHDNISALLSSAGMQLQAFTNQTQNFPVEITKTKQILENAHDQVRDLSHELMPSLLVRFGLFDALEDLCEKNTNSILNFVFNSSVDRNTRYNEDFEMKIYFIIMELINNTIKHSTASQSIVSLDESNDSLHIKIIDNGKGFDSSNFHILEGFGINQIKSRINNLKGIFYIDSKLNWGTTVSIEVPIHYHKKNSNPVYPTQ